jgi:type III pantothenate kinase
MNLLIDIGNSRCKWGLAQPSAHAQLVRTGVFERIDVLQTELASIEQTAGIPAQAMLASVGAEQVYRDLLRNLQHRWPSLKIRRFESSARMHGVINAYLQPATLGVDRWAALIAAHNLKPGNSMIVSCGTAMTVDVIDSEGRHQGGYILPGLNMMRTALHTGTAALPLAEGAGLDVGRSTAAAISSGTLLGLVAAVESIASVQAKHYKKLQCILTGGDGELVGRHLKIPYHYEPDLVLKGLAIEIEAER